MGTRVSRANPTGVESFDHAAVSRLPEYRAAVQALDKLVHAIERSELGVVQPQWLKMVRRMAASLPFADACHMGDCRGKFDVDWLHWPHRVEVGDGGLVGTYRCSRGHEWKCWYSLLITECM